MGKGDIKSKRGKINRGTSGVKRQKKKSVIIIPDKPKAAPKKKAAENKKNNCQENYRQKKGY